MIEIPGYVIKGEIGVGGMASVHLAMQSSLAREVALKVMAPALAADPVYSKRFLEEARMLASLAHPNIVAVYDVDVTPGQLHYFSMQYLPGGDFNTRVKRGMDERELTLTLAGVASALGYAHKRGYVHCDVAPGNILYDSNSNPVLTDFGIALASASGARITSNGFAVGTSHYMSPEQARGGDVDARSDIYSLGVLAYFGLTGTPPFDGADGFAVAYAHVFEPIPRLPAEHEHWQPLIDRALAKSPADRHGDIDEFLDAMAEVVPAFAPLFRDDAVAAAVSGDATRPAETEPATRRLAPAAREARSRDAKPGGPGSSDAVVRGPPVAPPSAPDGSAARRRGPDLSAWAQRAWLPLIIVLGIALVGTAVFMRGGSRSTAPHDSAAANTADVGRTAPAMPASTAVTPATTTSQTGGSVADTMPAEPTSSNAVADFPTVVDPLVEALRNGRRDLVAQRLTIPPGDNAFENFRLALRLDPHNRAARKGIADIAAKYVEFAGKSLNEGDVAQFNDYLDRATGVLDPPSDYDDVLKRIADVRRQAAAPLIASAGTAAAAWNKVAASAAYRKALQLDPGNRTALDGLKFVATIGQPGFVFHDKLADASAGPPMVILPGAKVAMARHEITRGEFRRYWRAGGRAAFAKRSFSCRDRESIFRSSRDRDWQRPGIPQNDSHPVVCVTWLEAAAYARWLGKQTGRHYRLPSPGELTALERKVPRGPCKANLADAAYNHQYNSDDGSSCSDGFAATAPVDRFGLVDGISDIDGNVREWSAACGDGSPVPAGGSCRDYLVQGRGWLSRAGKEPATFSDTYADDVGLNTVGFRVVRDLGK